MSTCRMIVAYSFHVAVHNNWLYSLSWTTILGLFWPSFCWTRCPRFKTSPGMSSIHLARIANYTWNPIHCSFQVFVFHPYFFYSVLLWEVGNGLANGYHSAIRLIAFAMMHFHFIRYPFDSNGDASCCSIFLLTIRGFACTWVHRGVCIPLGFHSPQWLICCSSKIYPHSFCEVLFPYSRSRRKGEKSRYCTDPESVY